MPKVSDFLLQSKDSTEIKEILRPLYPEKIKSLKYFQLI